MYDEDGVGGLSREFSSGESPPPRGRTRPKRKRPVKDRSAAFQKPEPGNWAGAPKGYDSDIWHLAKGFQQGCEWAGGSLHNVLPVVYTEIKNRLEWDKKIADTPNLAKQKIKLVELMIQYFWNHWNHYMTVDDIPYGLHYFTMIQHWEDIREIVIQEAWRKHLDKEATAGRLKTRKKKPVSLEDRPKRPHPKYGEAGPEKIPDRPRRVDDPERAAQIRRDFLRRRAERDERSQTSDHEDR